MSESPLPKSTARPEPGERLRPAHPSAATVELLLRRRSTTAKDLGAPGPSPQALDLILTAASRVPDHGKLAPWRFILFEGTARARFGTVLAARFAEANPGAGTELLAFEQARFERAPVVVGVVSRAAPHAKIPEWEQQLSAGAVCQTMLLAAQALGFAGQWLTEWYAYDASIAAALGLQGGERIAGFVYLGTAQAEPTERPRPELADLVARWEG